MRSTQLGRGGQTLLSFRCRRKIGPFNRRFTSIRGPRTGPSPSVLRPQPEKKTTALKLSRTETPPLQLRSRSLARAVEIFQARSRCIQLVARLLGCSLCGTQLFASLGSCVLASIELAPRPFEQLNQSLALRLTPGALGFFAPNQAACSTDRMARSCKTFTGSGARSCIARRRCVSRADFPPFWREAAPGGRGTP